MIFNNYYVSRDQELDVHRPENTIEGGPIHEDNAASIEDPIVPIGDIGASVPEGSKFGTFIQSMQQAIRKGAGKLELATGMGGGQEPVGAESYGSEAREQLREIARANDVKVHSIHSPSQVGNLSGYNPQSKGFNEEHRKMEIEEVKKAIDFASDVTQGGSVVVHTGEYMRDMTSQKWNKPLGDGTYEMQSFEEEPERQTMYMVDDRTGELVQQIKKTQVIAEPKFKTLPNPKQGNREQWVDENGEFIDESDPDALFKRVPEWDDQNTRFRANKLTWDNFVQRAEELNKWNPKRVVDPYTKKTKYEKWTPEELMFKSKMDNQILQARGSSLFHGRMYPDHHNDRKELLKLREYYEKLEKQLGPDEAWKIAKQEPKIHRITNQALASMAPSETKTPTEVLDKALKDNEDELKYIREASAAADAQAEETYETMSHVQPIAKFAKEQTSKSYAEAALHAMDRTKEKKLKDPIYVAPENIFPEMGYGSHPDELIELVHTARDKMKEYLSKPMIEDPKQGWEQMENGKFVKKVVKNPYYRGLSEKEAEKYAENHIKATFDTQHLGMWWKHFQPKKGETVEKRKQRFDKWYMEQVKKLADSGVLGNIHLVDGIGGGHHHLPAGQGDMPVVEAMKYLKKKGYSGNITSEGYGEDHLSGSPRQLSQTWQAMGNSLFRGQYWGGAGGDGFGAPQRWTDVNQSYFGQNQAPYFMFGNYVPSNDWSLWSQVPLE